VLSFYQLYSFETPAGAPVLYYGWDGMNVRISNYEGETWQVLQNPVPAYTCNSLYGFGNVHGEGDHIPGWSGLQSNWQHVSINLSSYTNDTIMIRFAFASDGGYCTSDNHEMFGWQVDDILVSSSSGNLFENNGSLTGMKSHSAFSEVNIIEGKYRLREDARCGIATYNALNHTSYSNAIDFVEEDSIFSADTNMCGVTLHYALEKTYDYYLNIHGRHSFDDTDNRILGYANWIFDYGTSQDPNNAMWNGSFTCFGTGDGWQFGPWGSIDIAGHEFTHGVTQYSAGLLYQNEPGALNESFSDIFGTGVEFFTGDGDWLCGEDICMSLPCLRSMENPKSRNNPDTYRGTYWVSTSSTPAQSNDFNGVHTNCGVQNFWFYLTSVGGMGDNDLGDPFSITGIGISDAEQIAYRNLTVYLTPTSEYNEAVLYSLQSAEDLFGTGSTQYNTVMDAWYAVGLSFSPKIRIPEYLRITVNESNPGSGSINIRSIGLTTLSVTDLEIEGDGFSITNMPSLPLELENDESYALNITFAPESIGTTNGSFMISSNDPDYPDKTITVEGINIVDALDQISICTEQDTRIYSSPNPFVSTTQINYCLNQSSDVMVKIYNLDGKEILTLVDASQTSGEYSVIWEGNDFTGTQVYPGIYFCILQTNDEFIVTKMMLNQ